MAFPEAEDAQCAESPKPDNIEDARGVSEAAVIDAAETTELPAEELLPEDEPAGPRCRSPTRS